MWQIRTSLQSACSITTTKQAINATYKNNGDLCSYVFFNPKTCSVTRLLDTDLLKQADMTKQSQWISWVHQTVKKWNNLTFFRITLLEKPNPILKVLLRSVFYSNILLHPSFCGKYLFKFIHKEISKMAAIACYLVSPTYFRSAVNVTNKIGTSYMIFIVYRVQAGISRQKVGKVDGNKL